MRHFLGGVPQPAAGGGWSPSDLPNLALWLDANDNNTFTFSSANNVSAWADKSGNGDDGTKSGAGTVQRITNVINGNAVVRFASSGQIDFSNFASSFTAAELFIVIKLNADPSNNPGAGGLLKAGSDGVATHYPFTNGVVYDGFGTTIRKTTGDPTPSLASWRLYNVRTAANAWSNHIDGTQHYSTGTNTVGFSTGIVLGVDSRASSTFLVGDIAEIVWTSAVLGTDDRADLHGYFEAKFGLTIA